MDFMRGIVIWGGVAVASGAAGAVLAGVKNRDYSSWTAWCFVLPPLVLVLLVLPRYQGTRPRQPRPRRERRPRLLGGALDRSTRAFSPKPSWPPARP